MSRSDSRRRPPQQAAPTDAYDAQVRAAIVESRQFLAHVRAAFTHPDVDPDELQARMMRRTGCPDVEHYARLFRAEGMPPAQAEAEARRMVAADRELLARHPTRL